MMPSGISLHIYLQVYLNGSVAEKIKISRLTDELLWKCVHVHLPVCTKHEQRNKIALDVLVVLVAFLYDVVLENTLDMKCIF